MDYILRQYGCSVEAVSWRREGRKRELKEKHFYVFYSTTDMDIYLFQLHGTRNIALLILFVQTLILK